MSPGSQHPPGIPLAASYGPGVVGVPDPYWSEAVTAFVVLKPACTATSDELLDHARSNLAAYRAPKAVHVVKELPTDSQGKILKRVLRSGRPS